MKQRLFQAAFGYILIGIASGFFVYCNLGPDCLNTLVNSCAKLLHLQVGTASYALQMTLLVIVLLLGGRRHAGIGTIAGSLIVSVIVNIFGSAFAPHMQMLPLAPRLALVLAASPLAGFGLALVQLSGLGSTANDILPILLSERLPQLQFRTVRICYDCTELVLGVALGTMAGIGTLSAALLIGPSLQFSLELLTRPRAAVHQH